MSEDKRIELLERFLKTFEMTVKSDMPEERKRACIETLYLAFCTATDRMPNYELLKKA
jgi:hypothetical protein